MEELSGERFEHLRDKALKAALKEAKENPPKPGDIVIAKGNEKAWKLDKIEDGKALVSYKDEETGAIVNDDFDSEDVASWSIFSTKMTEYSFEK